MQPRHILLACIVQLCFAATAVAGDGTDKFTVGVESGGGISALYISHTNYYVFYNYPSPAVSVGADFRYNFNKTFSLGTGLYYNRVGFTQSIEEGPVAINLYRKHMQLNYLTLPVVARASFGKKVKFFVEAGGYISVLAKREYIDLYPNVEFVDAFRYQPPDQFRRVDAGVTGGVGLDIPLPHHFGITIEERNNVGLTKIISNLHNYQCVMLAGATYSFGGKKK